MLDVCFPVFHRERGTREPKRGPRDPGGPIKAFCTGHSRFTSEDNDVCVFFYERLSEVSVWQRHENQSRLALQTKNATRLGE